MLKNSYSKNCGMGKYQNKMYQYNETTTLRQFRGDRSSHSGYIEYAKHMQ